MNLYLEIAIRYVFGKKSTNAINIITGIAVLGMAIGSAVLLLILSVFNGFEDLISNLFNSYNPDIKITPSKAVYFDIDSTKLEEVYKIKGIENMSISLEEVVLFEYDGSQEAGYLKGVDSKYSKVNNIDSTIIRGKFNTGDSKHNYAVLGGGMYNKLNVNPSDAITPITVYAALKSSGPLAKDYATLNLYPSGVFSIGSEEDGKYVLTNIQALQSLINKPNAFNAIEIRKEKNTNEAQLINELKRVLGDKVTIKNRYQQDEAFLRIMNIEKWIAYLIACLTLALITFNLIGALWMIVIDKKKDISILKSMGFTNGEVKKTIISLGVLIGSIGLSIGLVLALIFYFLQKEYGLIAVPPNFMINSYPIALKISDVFLVSFTVLLLAYLASLLPSTRASKISAFVRQE